MTIILKLIYTLLVFILWALLFEFINRSLKVNISQGKLNDFKNRIIAMTHGTLAFWLCSLTLLFRPDLLDKGESHTISILMIISLSYFTYDTIACYHYGLMDRSLAIHHMVSVGSLGLCLMGLKGSFYLIIGLALAEISNVPMHLRVILRNLGLKYTKTHDFCQNLYFFQYIVARGVIAPIALLVPAFLTGQLSLVLKGMLLLMQLQAFMFIYEMVGIIKRVQNRNKEMEDKNIQFSWMSVDPQKLAPLSFYKREAD